MRLFTLGGIAAQAEAVRFRAMLKRQVMRVAMGGAATVFGVLMAVMLHIAAFEFIAEHMRPGFAALIVAGVDLLLCGLFGLLAGRGVASFEEREAAALSRQARGQIATSLASFAVLAPISRLVAGGGWKSAMLTALASNFISGRRRG